MTMRAPRPSDAPPPVLFVSCWKCGAQHEAIYPAPPKWRAMHRGGGLPPCYLCRRCCGRRQDLLLKLKNENARRHARRRPPLSRCREIFNHP